MQISSQNHYIINHKPQITNLHRLSLPSQSKWKHNESFREADLQNKTLYSHPKLLKHTSLVEGLGLPQNKKPSYPRVTFNVFKQQLASYLNAPSLSTQQKQKQYQIPNVSTTKSENYKIQLFRSYKKKKPHSKHYQHLSPQLQHDFYIKQIEIKNRQSMQKEQTMPNIAVKRECLRYFGENTCFEKALQFRKKSPSPQPQIAKQQQIQKEKPILAVLQFSAEDVEKIKVQPWMEERQYSLQRDLSFIQDIQ